MMDVKIFDNEEFGSIRTTEKDGNVLFCGKDVAKALGYARPTKAVKDHCKGVLKQEVLTNGGIQKMNFIREGDLYRLIANSKLPKAVTFERWIFDKVIPSIRKNGGYIANQENLTNEQILANGILVAENIIKNQNKKIETMKPKALFADAVANSNNTVLVRELAKIIKQNGTDIGEERLFKWLRENGYLIRRRGSDYNMPTQKSMELGLFKINETVISSGNGNARVSKTPKVTGKGKIYFVNKFISNDK